MFSALERDIEGGREGEREREGGRGDQRASGAWNAISTAALTAAAAAAQPSQLHQQPMLTQKKYWVARQVFVSNLAFYTNDRTRPRNFQLKSCSANRDLYQPSIADRRDRSTAFFFRTPTPTPKRGQRRMEPRSAKVMCLHPIK